MATGEPWYVRHRPKSSVPKEWRDPVLSKLYYPLSCFTFSALSVPIYCFRSPLTTKLPSVLPWDLVALVLLCQGPASYMADVHSLARDSWWHFGDILMACFLSAFYGQIMLFGFCHGTLKGLLQLGSSLSGLIAGIYCFTRARAARAGQHKDMHAYAFWHSCWHLGMPAGTIGTITISLSMEGEPQPATAKMYLVSSVVLGIMIVIVTQLSRSLRPTQKKDA
mmetsp:Transcript_75138/g.141702  ORF Transcript_75138/g.141702 Transcript_75138/m.141702 type:complete len:222 (-) Transcript_75138:31-696(-)